VSKPAVTPVVPSPAVSVQKRAPDEPRAPRDQADARRGDGQEVRAHRHGPHDEDPVAVEDAVGRDDAGDGHQHQEAGARPGLLAGLAEQVGPDHRAALAPPAQASGLQPLEAQQPDVLGGHAESAERLQGRVGRNRVDVGGHERVAVPVAGIRPRDVRGTR
jgi:hypothetical protein